MKTEQLFREVVFVLGGVFAERGTDDVTIRRIALGLERVYRRARGDVITAVGPPPGTPPLRHPAITALLELADQPFDDVAPRKHDVAPRKEFRLDRR